MSIDWITVGFQLLNFLVALWILNRFLFKPVMAAMEKRDEGIRRRIALADKAVKDAEDEKQKLANARATLATEQNRIIDEARSKTELEQKRLMKELNIDIAKKREAFEKEIVRERKELRDAVSEIAGHAVISTAEAALSGLAGLSLQSAIAAKFAEDARAGKLSGVDKLKTAFERHKKLFVRTPVALDDNEQKLLSEAAAGLIKTKPEFEVDGKMAPGVAFVSGDVMLLFGVAGYIDGIGERITKSLATVEE